MVDIGNKLPDIDNAIFAGNAVLVDNPDSCTTYLDSPKKSIKIVAQNIRSINHNFHDFEILLSRLNISFDIITLTECWLSKSDVVPLLPGYESFKTKKHINQNSGVIIYKKNSVSKSKVTEPHLDDANVLLIEIGEHSAIVSIYRPPCFNTIGRFLLSLDKLLSQLKNYQNITVVGDINIDIKYDSNDTRSPDYLNLLATHGLLPSHLIPTRINSCLDHCFVKTKYPTTTLIYDSTITDHATVIFSILYNNIKLNSELQTIIHKINYPAVIHDLSFVNWDTCIFQHTDPNNATNVFLDTITTIIKKHTIMTKLSKRKIILKPWITPGLLKCIRFRDRLHIKTKKQPNNEIIRISYLRYRNYCNRILKNLKKHYERKLIQTNKGDIKKTWQVIKNICNLNQSSNIPIELLNITNDPEKSISLVNKHFANIGRHLANKILNKLETNEDKLQNNLKNNINYLPNSFVLLPTDHSEIKNIILSLRNSESTGWDNIPSKFYKMALNFLVSPITYICNLCITHGEFPTNLKKSIVIPIFKTGNRDNVNNYRPISLLPTLSKILEKIINIRLQNYLEKYNLLSSNQYGFRAKMSTVDAINKLVTHAVQQLDNNKKCVGIFLDLAKAFDTVSIPLLLRKLEFIGIRGVALKLLHSYLTNRIQIVKIGSTLSSTENLTCGLPQGSVIAPTLFLIYIDSLCRIDLNSAQIISFADDTAVLFGGNTWNDVNKAAEMGFSKINKWLNHNLLTVNLDKTKFITFRIKNDNLPETENFTLRVHDCKEINECQCYKLARTDTIKYLGVVVDQNLRWIDHIKLLVGRVRKLIYIFKGLKHINDENTIRNVYFCLCQSIISYAITTWGGASKTHMLELERAQRAVLKVMGNKPYYYSTTQLYSEMKLLTVRQLFIKTITIHQHRIPLNSVLQSNKRRIIPYAKPLCRTEFSHRFALYLGPYIYNKINKHIDILNETTYSCKKKIDKYLQSLTYNETEQFLN